MKRFIAWIIASTALSPYAYSSNESHWHQWESAYNDVLAKNDSKALSMLRDRYNSLPPSTEKLYISSKLHGYMTQRGQPYYGNVIASNPSYSNLEQAFIAALNGELELDFTTARSKYVDLLKHANIQNDIQGKILFEYHLCRSLNMQGSYYNAQLYCNALQTHLADVTDTLLPKHDALRVIANNLEFTGNYQTSLETYQQYLAIIPSYVDPSGVYNDAGLLLKLLGQYELSKEYLTISLNLRESASSPLAIAQTHHSMGDLLLTTHDYHDAIAHLMSAKDILDSLQHIYGLTHVTLGLGKAYSSVNQFELANKHLSQALEYANTQGNDQIRGDIYLAQSNLANLQGDYNVALEHLDQAYALSEKIHSERLKTLTLKSKALLAESAGDYETSLGFYQRYLESELSKRASRNRSAFLELEKAQQEFNQKVKDDKLLEIIDSLDTEIARLISQRQLHLLYITLLIIGIVGQYLIARSRSRRAEMDQLTGSLNRAASINRIKAVDKPSSDLQKHVVMLLDLDDFKMINDTYGHPTGDRALTTISNTISASLHRGDVLGRLGGEEFVVVMKNVDEIDIRFRVEALHNSIAASSFTAQDNKKLNVTASVSYLATETSLSNFDELYSILDQALYQAKANGKNQILDACNEPIHLANSAYLPMHP